MAGRAIFSAEAIKEEIKPMAEEIKRTAVLFPAATRPPD
jgi:hypothetical protein